MKSVVTEKEDEEETIKPKYLQAKDIVLNVNGAVLFSKEKPNVEFAKIPCIRVVELEPINYLFESREILKNIQNWIV